MTDTVEDECSSSDSGAPHRPGRRVHIPKVTRPSAVKKASILRDLEQQSEHNGLLSQYDKDDFPLAYDLLKYQNVRDASFHCDGFDQFVYPQSNDGWLETLFVLRGRALHNVFIPWLFVSLHSVAIVLILELVPAFREMEDVVGDWATFYGLVLNVVLSFLLVFRCNRSATRYWESRKFWGVLIANGRTLVSGILAHGGHDPVVRDEAVRWVCAVAVAVMTFMRGDHQIPNHTLDGILTRDEEERLESAAHMPLYASDRIRDALQRLFMDKDVPSMAHTVQLDRLEGELNVLMSH